MGAVNRGSDEKTLGGALQWMVAHQALAQFVQGAFSTTERQRRKSPAV